MGMIGQKWRRLREAWTVSAHGAGPADRAALFGAYLRLLAGPPGDRVLTVRMRLGALEREVAFRESDIFTFGEILHERQYALQRALPASPVLVDAGANIGVAALWLLGQYPTARMIVFEPEPGNAALLRRNLAGLPNVTVEEAAVGDSSEPLRLFLGGHAAEHSLLGSDGARSVTVQCHRLDEYMARHRIDRIHLLKLDVEGSELRVLHGLGERLDAVDAIVGEFHESMVEERGFYGYLEARGFRVLARGATSAQGDPVHAFAVARDRSPTPARA
jgi:FkbM family methyltransferase